jgi:signal transduction histidine kinase/ActR/RegA family two-component response regulator
VKERFAILAPIVAVILLFLTVTWVGVLTVSQQAKQTEVDRSYDASEQLSKVFAEQVARTIDSVESLIDFAAFEILQHGAPDQLKEMSDFGALSFTPVVQIAFVDTQGFTLATNVGLDPALTDLRDREHIRVHLDGKVDGLYVGAPVMGRVSGKWSIQITRKVFDSEKKFAGIIVASVDPFYFQRFWTNTLRPGQLVSLMRDDGVVLTRSEGLQWALDSKLRRTDFIARIGTAQEGRIISESSDGVDRLSYFKRVPNLPLIVISGKDMKEVTASYGYKQTEFYAIGAALTLILLLLGAWLIFLALRLKNEELSARQAEQTARDAEKAKSSFLATMSHEIRTPLNALIGFTDLMRKTPLNEEQKSFVKTMQTSAQTLRNIVTDVLDFSKMENGALEIEKNPFNLHECCDELKKVTSLLIEEKPITVRMICETEVPETVIIDGPRLYQALLNICGNAAKFTQSGEIVISGSVIKKDAGERLVVVVSDTGPGISKEVQSKLFIPFEQGKVSGELRAAGTGLGLAISKSLLERMGGSIKVESELGNGSRFTIELPFERTDAAAKSETEDPIDRSSPPLRILVADDARASRALLRIILQKKGHSVIEAEDGAQALEIIQRPEQHLDLVFLDMQMPRVGGLDVAKSLQIQGGSKPMMVALSAQAQPEDQEAAANAGISAYITKPLREEQLQEVIQAASKRRTQGTIE